MPDRAMTLAQVVARLPADTTVTGSEQSCFTSLELDSRRVRPGALFVALQGEHHDGHAYIERAIAAGAVAIVAEAGRVPSITGGTAVVQVGNSRRALSSIAAAFYGDPSRELAVIGVTGTNGKTTTTQMIGAILNAAGRKAGVIGTVGADLGERHWPLENTTPLPPELHSLIAEMRDGGASAIAMEVSSHALALDRVEDVHFAVAALTNVSRDHLDFHGTIESYAAAKRRLFDMATAAVLNSDDLHGARWYGEIAGRIPTLTYALGRHADLVPRDIEIAADGTRFTLQGTVFSIALPGRFNIANALAAIGVARTLGIDNASSARGLAALERVPGRMEHVRGAGVDVVIDYSHTPDSLDNALSSLRETTSGTLAVVFGCGGDRDRGKRPEMGRIAAERADRIYLTSDNPRSEDPAAIASDVLPGIGRHPYVLELNRRRAIELAIAAAVPGDVILIAGKGHETYQIVGDRVLPFDDAAIARETLQQREVNA